MKRTRLRWFLLFLLLVAVAVVSFLCRAGNRDAAGIDEGRRVRVARKPLDVVVRETGIIEPIRQVRIKSKVAGRVAEVLVEPGDVVAPGEVLLRLDPREIEREVARARADLAIAQAEFERLLTPTEVQRRTTATQLELARETVAFEEERLERLLATPSVTSAQEIDAQRQKLHQARFELIQAEERLDGLTPRPEILAQARARVEKARIALATAQDRLADTVVRAPMAGSVIERGIEAGEVVSAGTSATFEGKPLLVIADLRRLRIVSDFNQIDVAKITEGKPVRVTLDAIPDQTYSGKVLRIAKAASIPQNSSISGVRTFRVETLLDELSGDHPIRPGMTADIDIVIEQVPEALVVPIEAVQKEKDGKGFVTIVEPGGGTRRRAVVLGKANEIYQEIASGLEEGEEVLLAAPPASERKLTLE
ncbi:MAG: efflux RND transporter periplasmic adaptor subunit [Deltaproteobacteria bacterium]|nr:MAG: efflux RND transporter periplasmic adaptor subunit [Deltaproteobacteria bacterium]